MIKYYYMIVAIPSICLNLLNFVLLRIATGIAIESPPIEKTKVGVNTESLRNKRVVSVNSNFSVK